MRILITGENGYISNELYSEINNKQEGFDITQISIRDGKLDSINFSDFDTMIHTAAIVHKKESSFSEEQYFQVNTFLTETLAKKAKKAGVKQFIFFSTMAVYGAEEGEIGVNSKTEPISLYGKSKLAAEGKLLNLSNEYFKVAIIRPPMIYGPKCPGNYRILSSISKKTFIFPEINNCRSMIFIYNLTEFVYQILKNQDTGIFHPQDLFYIKTSEMVNEISRINNRKIYFSSLIGRTLGIFVGNNKLYKKVFGDLYYNQELSLYRDNSYQKYNFQDAIKITEKK